MIDLNKLLIAKAKSENEKKRKSDIEKILDYYYGDQIQYLAKNPGEAQSEFVARSPFLCQLNVTKYITQKLSYLYKDPPEREIVEGSDRLTKLIEGIWTDPMYDIRMKESDIFARLLGDVFVSVIYDKSTNSIRLGFWQPDMIDIVQDEDDPSKAAMLITTTYYRDTTGVAYGSNKMQFVYTDDGIWKFVNEKLVQQENNPKNENPYGIIPFIHIQNDSLWGQYWSIGIGGELIRANATINNIFSDLIWTIKHQAFSTLAVKGSITGKPDIEIGPNAYIPLGIDGDAKYLSPDPEAPRAGLEVLEAYLNAVMATNNLKATSPLKLDIQSAESGVAKWIDQADIMEDRQARAVRFASYEKQIAQIAALVWGTHNGVTQGELDQLTIKIQFAEPKPPVSIDDEIRRDEHLLNNNVITPVDILMREDPDIDREAALNQIIENVTTNGRIISEALKRRMAGLTPQEKQFTPTDIKKAIEGEGK